MSAERPEGRRSAAAERLTRSISSRTRLRVRFVLGRVEMATSELMKLSPGRILSLDSPLTPRLDVVVEGVSIGRGELVAIEGERGVRLLSVDDAER